MSAFKNLGCYNCLFMHFDIFFRITFFQKSIIMNCPMFALLTIL